MSSTPPPRPPAQTHLSVGQLLELPRDNQSPFVAAGQAEGSDQRKLLPAHVVMLCSQLLGTAEQDKLQKSHRSRAAVSPTCPRGRGGGCRCICSYPHGLRLHVVDVRSMGKLLLMLAKRYSTQNPGKAVLERFNKPVFGYTCSCRVIKSRPLRAN